MPEEYKIDYTGIQIPDIESIKRTSQQFTDWRRSMGFQTEEEKEAARLAAIKQTQEELSNLDWNSEDAEGIYRSFASPEDIRTMETAKGVGTTVATLPFTAGMTGGWTPAIVSTITGAAGGQAGAYGGQKLGQYIDDKYGTNLTPGLTFSGGLLGGTIGGGLGYKGWEGVTNQYIINKAFKSGQLRWGDPTSYAAYHQSATPITKFKFPFKERWDVRTHGADPNGAFFTIGEPAAAGFLAERPYTGQFQVKVQKPLIQTGELIGPTKNGLRNAIVKRARKNGADAVFFDGIADNQLQNQQILFAMDNVDIGYRGMVGTPFKQGNWQLPRGVRNQVLNGHLKGNDAVQMFKDYGIVSIPANSKIYSDIQKLVSEARERYGLVGHTGITNDEIAGSLYKRAMELNGEGNAAVWETGEPRLLFRGDTRRYNRLMDKWSPEKLAKGKGTMDNSLGNLFLGDISGKGQGVDRYFISGTDFFEPRIQGSATGARGKFGTIFDGGGEGVQGTVIPYIPKDAYELATYQTASGPYSLYKFPGKYSESGISDLNAFITRTPAMRDATGEISVLADDFVMKTKNYRGPNIDDYDGPTYDGINSTVRDAMAKHYQSILDDAQSKGQGLLFSEGLTDEYVKKFGGIHPFRREHERYDYYALPNFNRQNVKHLFGWDLRKPVQWDVDNIYLEKGGKIENPDH